MSTALGTACDLQIGDLVFIRVTARPFLEVSSATNSWTNHVGIVIARSGDDVLIAESTFPRARTTSLHRFLARTEAGRFCVARLARPLDDVQRQTLVAAAMCRMGTFYDTGFNLGSRRQFCSRLVREVIHDATGTQIGDVETFGDLLDRHPDASLVFWRVWFFGRIPWRRYTVTPASLLRSEQLRVLYTSHPDAPPHSATIDPTGRAVMLTHADDCLRASWDGVCGFNDDKEQQTCTAKRTCERDASW